MESLDFHDREAHSQEHRDSAQSFGQDIQLLLKYGHTRQDIFDYRQPGLPYEGWTLTQFWYWVNEARRQANEDRADDIDTTANAIIGTFGDKRAKAALTKLLKTLRDEDGRAESINPGGVEGSANWSSQENKHRVPPDAEKSQGRWQSS